MVLMARGISMANMLKLYYIAVEYLNTIPGSIGQVAVDPLTAVVGGYTSSFPSGRHERFCRQKTPGLQRVRSSFTGNA